MAVYFDHRIEAPVSSDVPTQLCWHSAIPVLAVASSRAASGGIVDLYLQQVKTGFCRWSLVEKEKTLSYISVPLQGEYVENCHFERSHQATVLRWHPTKPVLVLGWENGEIVLLTHPSGDQTVLPSTHSASISLLEWSSSGSRLVTGDQVFVAITVNTHTLTQMCKSYLYNSHSIAC